MKITRAEFTEWHNTAWPKGYIWSDGTTLVAGDPSTDIYPERADGSEDSGLSLPETFTVPDWWTLEYERTLEHAWDRDNEYPYLSVRSCIRSWRKAKAFVTIAVTVPREDVETAESFCRSRGWKTSR